MHGLTAGEWETSVKLGFLLPVKNASYAKYNKTYVVRRSPQICCGGSCHMKNYNNSNIHYLFGMSQTLELSHGMQTWSGITKEYEF